MIGAISDIIKNTVVGPSVQIYRLIDISAKKFLEQTQISISCESDLHKRTSLQQN